jgi:CRISPR/Cas system CSM-associated protein Csm3 (group 7 of RAMP superfamily)
MAQFRNPYNFVPVRDTVERTPYTQLRHHHRLYREADNRSGRLACKTTTLTRLFIPSRLDRDIVSETIVDWQGNPVRSRRGVVQEHPIFKRFLRNHLGQPMIPGTSIRGVIRAVAETISNSCLTLFDGDYRARRGQIRYSDKVADALKHQNCKIADEKGKPITTENHGLCLCCQIFGMANEQEQDTKLDEQILRNVFASKVIFSDAILETIDKIDPQTITLKELSSPKPHHAPFYIHNNQIKGRKFYYHQSDSLSHYNVPHEKTHRNQTIQESVTPGAEFTFDVMFTNLTDSELGLLLWSLELEEEMAHKIGMGKPIGLGSIKIDVNQIDFIDPLERYTSLGGGKASVAGENLLAQIAELRAAYDTAPFASTPELRDILTFDLTSGDEVRYPGRDWFNQDSRIGTQLPTDGKLNDPPRGSAISARSRGSASPISGRASKPPPKTETHQTTQSLGDLLRPLQAQKTDQSASGERVVQVKRINAKNRVFVDVDGEEVAIANPPYTIRTGDTIKVRLDRDARGQVTATFKGKV